MEVKLEEINQNVDVIDTIEIKGEFIMEQRHRHERRQRQLLHNPRYERRISKRRNAHRDKINIII
jgi:hypothetical protein